MRKKVTVKPNCPNCNSIDVGVKEYNTKSVRFKCKNEECDTQSFSVTYEEIEKLENLYEVAEKELEIEYSETDKICPKCGEILEHYGYKSLNGKPIEEFKCDSCGKVTTDPIAPDDISMVKESVRIAKSRQKFQDINRVERKVFRESARIDNTLEELNTKLISLLEESKNYLTNITIKHNEYNENPIGIVQISDTHFGENVVQSSNKYNWDIATKRLKKLVDRAKVIFNAHGIETIALLFTGDLMNSDRRLDEILTNSDNRTKTMFTAFRVLSEMIVDLNVDYNVIVSSVIGNESRVKDEMMFSKKLISDNYDYSIHNMLKHAFEDSEGVFFMESQWDESIVSINGKNILMCHGHNLKASGLDNHVQKMIGKYASEGILVDFVIFGHIHSACISDNYSRSSSLVGDNAYSNKGLNLSGRASQNIHIVYEDGIDSFKIDLQNTDNIEGYSFESKYESYNEIVDYNKNETTVFKVVI